MREIKFRFYSNHLGKFVTPDDSIFVGALKDHDMNPMQYTGLRDKNGVEIYEGDIIASDQTVTSSLRLGKASPVEYTSDLARFTYYWGHHLSSKGVNRHHMKVIGNIYENPELLK